MLSDTHCHLNFNTFHEDRDEVIARALQSGIRQILNPGVDLTSSRAAVKLADTYPLVFASVGVHPNEALSWNEHTLDELRILSMHPKVVAIGEIGLDYYRNRSPHDLQQHVFRQQLTLAEQVGLPVVIHTRDASASDRQAMHDVLDILESWWLALQTSGSNLAQRPGVLHSFSGDGRAAQQAIQNGFYIGITGPVTFRNAPGLQQLVATLPVERLLIETDAPFLAPHPHRGQRNEPAYVRLVAEKIAEIHHLPFNRIAEVTSYNAERLFHWLVPD